MLPNCLDHIVSQSCFGFLLQGWVRWGWGADWQGLAWGKKVRREYTPFGGCSALTSCCIWVPMGYQLHEPNLLINYNYLI